ncbi:MAG: hypothetical protein IJ621_06700 [Paludibacteraceae bacterium]|nr:hypothetical protein [Paludibacteraceae bacterium]
MIFVKICLIYLSLVGLPGFDGLIDEGAELGVDDQFRFDNIGNSSFH